MDDLDKQLINEEEKVIQKKSSNVWICGRFWGDLFSDVIQATLGFIPNGLNITYDCTLKRLPLLGSFFGHQWVEESLKMVTGITIGRGLSRDLGRYVFWSMGFVVGMCFSLFTNNHQLKYRGKFGQLLYQLSGQTVLGSLVGAIALIIGTFSQSGLSILSLSWQPWAVAIIGGAMIGLMAKSIMLIALEAVTRANAASSRLNAKRAQKLGVLLKKHLKEKTHQKVYTHAKGIIEQNYGSQTQASLTHFFAHHHDAVCETTFKKIDRHIHYLTDRAIHGDVVALKKLFNLYRDGTQQNGAVDEMLNRILNNREILNLKDHVDNLFDRWSFRHIIGQPTSA